MHPAVFAAVNISGCTEYGASDGRKNRLNISISDDTGNLSAAYRGFSLDKYLFRRQFSENSWTIINGNSQHISKITYYYVATALQPGTYELSGIHVMVNGQKVEANPVTMTILDSGTTPTPVSQAQSPQSGLPGNQSPQLQVQPPVQPSGPDSTNFENGLYLEPVLNKKQAYVGEEII